MKEFNWNIKLSVSEQNASLIPLLVQSNGQAIESETNDEAVLRIVGERFAYILKEEMIISRLNDYFGKQGKETVDSINLLLDSGALTIVSEIIEPVI